MIRSIRWGAGPCFLLACVALGFSEPVREEPSRSITAAAIRRHVEFLAGGELGGRGLGSPGLRRASLYAVSRFREARLKPVFVGTKGLSYFQPVPLELRSMTLAPAFKIRTAAGERVLRRGEDFKWLGGFPPPGPARLREAVNAGYAIGEPEGGRNDLAGLELRDKIVLFRTGIPSGELPEALAARYGNPNSFMRKLTNLIPSGPAALLIVPGPELDDQWDDLPDGGGTPSPVLLGPTPGGEAPPFMGILRASVGNSLAPSGWDSPGKIRDVAIEVSGSPIDKEVEGWNLAGAVPGRDSVLKEEVVIVSAHLDHLATGPDGRMFPGANDNASGVAALLEAAAAMTRRPARRTVMFVLFTAEEGGSMGAFHFLSNPPGPRDRIVADINMDMVGRNESEGPTGRVQYALDADVIRPGFRRLIAEANARTVEWPLAFDHRLGLGASDHWAFEAYRIPAVNFYSGKVPDTHKPTDTPDKIDYEKAAAIARLVLETARELGNRDRLWE